MKIEMCDEFYYKINHKGEKINTELNSCDENVLRNNNKISFYAGEWIKVKVNNYLTYIVKPAESLQDIANKYSISCDKIIFDNKLETKKLYIGQILKIFK